MVQYMQLDFNEVKKLIPQRFPFIMIDKILELEPGNYAISMKNITVNDSFFPGHFPENPIMPGTLILEAMAQTVIFLYSTEKDMGVENKNEKKPIYYFGSVKARFLHPVVPGDQLKIKVVNVKSLPTGAFVKAEAFVDEKKVSEAELVFSVRK